MTTSSGRRGSSLRRRFKEYCVNLFGNLASVAVAFGGGASCFVVAEIAGTERRTKAAVIALGEPVFRCAYGIPSRSVEVLRSSRSGFSFPWYGAKSFRLTSIEPTGNSCSRIAVVKASPRKARRRDLRRTTSASIMTILGAILRPRRSLRSNHPPRAVRSRVNPPRPTQPRRPSLRPAGVWSPLRDDSHARGAVPAA